MKNWKHYLALTLVAGLVVLFLVIKNSLEIGNSVASQATGGDTPEIMEQVSALQTSGEDKTLRSNSADVQDNFESELIEKLKASYGARIQELNIQASLIKVKKFILERYPEDGIERFVRIIKAAFPEHAASILSIIDRLEIYNEWLVDNQTMLMELTKIAQNGTVWEKRRELFGADAEIIWADERAELDQKQSKMHALIQELDQASDLSMDEKLYQLQTAVSENYEGSVQELASSGGLLAKAFFNLESVQQELRQLPAEDRQQAINDVRRQLGLDEEQIAHMQAKDEARDKRWDNGLAYMKERGELIASTSEYDRDDALAELREKYFKHEAITIQREEESEFWRYERRRVFGHN